MKLRKRIKGGPHDGGAARQLQPDWKYLPKDVYVYVFSLLERKDHLNLRLVCRYFKDIVDLPTFWFRTKVSLNFINRFPDNFFRVLRARRIRQIEVSKVSPQNLKTLIDYLPEVVAVSLTSPITEKKLRSLKTLTPTLDQLSFQDCSRIGETQLVAPLPRFAALTKLTLRNVMHLTNSALASLASLKNLQEFCIGRCHKNESDFVDGRGLAEFIFQLPKLNSLKMYSVGLFATDVSLVFTHPHKGSDKYVERLRLTHLSLVQCFSCPLTAEAASQLDSLTSLSLRLSYLFRRRDLPMAQVCSIFQHLPNLRQLNMTSTNLKNECMQYIPKTVTSLVLRDCYSVSGLGLQALYHRLGPGLAHLDLSLCNRISELPLSSLHRWFPRLQHLDLSACRCVTPATFPHLVKLPRLRLVVLAGSCHLSPQDLRSLHTLSGNRIQVVGPDLDVVAERRNMFVH